MRRAIDEVLAMCYAFASPVSERGQASLEEELAHLRGGSRNRFVVYSTQVDGNAFVCFAEATDDPADVLNRYYQAILEMGESQTVHAVRLWPISSAIFASTDDGINVLSELIPRAFNRDEPLFYEVFMVRKHNCDADAHDALNDRIVAAVGGPHRPTYKNGSIAVLWIALGRDLFLGIAERWTEYHQYNVAKVAAEAKARLAMA